MSLPRETSAITLSLSDENAMAALAARLALCLAPGWVVHLVGPLGAGKTTFVRAILRALGHTGPVKSPTYGLVELYPVSGLNLYHFDFYRFATPEEFYAAGLEEYFDGTGVCLVEWPEKAAALAPGADLTITIEPRPDGSREVRLTASTPRARQCLNRLAAP